MCAVASKTSTALETADNVEAPSKQQGQESKQLWTMWWNWEALPNFFRSVGCQRNSKFAGSVWCLTATVFVEQVLSNPEKATLKRVFSHGVWCFCLWTRNFKLECSVSASIKCLPSTPLLLSYTLIRLFTLHFWLQSIGSLASLHAFR